MLSKFIVFIGFIFYSALLFGQGRCDLSKLSENDKKAMNTFWNDFKEAVTSRDTSRLASLCSFPFSCTYCKKKITQISFYESEYRIFFEDDFITEINKHIKPEDYFISHGDYYEKHRTCSYVFSYFRGKEKIFFDVTKIDESYKITSTWKFPK